MNHINAIKSYFLLIILLSVINTSTYSQKIYYPGYVVLNIGDTLFGEVMDRNIQKGQLLSKIRFKSKNTKRRKYTPADIISYKVDNSIFESKWFAEQTRFFKFDYLNKYGVGEKVFLRVNVKGRLSCYTREFVDPDSDLFEGFELFQKKGDEYFQRANQGVFGLKKKKLRDYFQDCPDLVEKLNNDVLEYAVDVANYYNTNCY